MNWLDFVIIALLVVGSLMGMKFGLIRAGFTAAGALIGSLVAGQFSDDIGAIFEQSVSNDTIVTVLSYGVIIIAAIAVANIAVKVVKPLLTVVTLGLSSMIDRLGGLALGLIFSLAISAALIVGLARLTYNFDISALNLAGGEIQEQFIGDAVAQGHAQVQAAREGLETSLSASQLVSVFIDMTDFVPADALGYIPSDFQVALDILEAHID